MRMKVPSEVSEVAESKFQFEDLNGEEPAAVLEASGTDGSDEGDLKLSGPPTVVMEKSDRSLSEYHRWYKDHRLKLDPD